MGLQDCVSVDGHHFCLDTATKKLVEVAIVPLPEIVASDKTCDKALKQISMKRYGLFEGK